MPVRAVLFDAGSTLWTGADWTEVWARVLKGLGHTVPGGVVSEALERAWSLLGPLYEELETWGSPPGEGRIADFWRRHDREVLKALGLTHLEPRVLRLVPEAVHSSRVLYPDTLPALQALRARGLRMAIVSNGWGQAETARRLGIDGFFEAVVGSVHVGVCCRLRVDPSAAGRGDGELDGHRWADPREPSRGLPQGARFELWSELAWELHRPSR